MTATFSTSLARPLDRVRFTLGDTDTAAALLDDAVIEAQLARTGSETTATEALAAYLMMRVPIKESADGVAIDNSALHARWNRIIDSASGYGTLTGGVIRVTMQEQWQ